MAEHGDEYEYINTQYYDNLPFLQNKTWQNYQVDFYGQYEIVSGVYFWLQYSYTNRKGDLRFGPEILHGKTNSIIFGINIGS